MTINKCINEPDADDLIFEEGSTGRELFVMLDARSNFEPIGARPQQTGRLSPASLRAKRSNPFLLRAARWIASLRSH